MTDVLEQAREAYARFGWDDAYLHYRAAAEREPLEAKDLAALADAAWWLGHNDEALTFSEEVYRRRLHGERVPRRRGWRSRSGAGGSCVASRP